MRRIRLLGAVFCMVCGLLAACGGGGENTPADANTPGGSACGSGGDGPFSVSLEMTGDNLADFKITIKTTGKVDFSSARSTAEAFVRLMSDDGDFRPMGDVVRERYKEVVMAAVLSAEKKLLSDDLIKEAVAERKQRKEDEAKSTDSDKPKAKRLTSKITSESPGEDGAVLFEVERPRDSVRKDASGKWVHKTRIEKKRLTCTKRADGTWGVSNLERWEEALEEAGTEGRWKDENVLMQMQGLNIMMDRYKAPPAIDTSSANSAAVSTVNTYFPMESLTFIAGIGLMTQASMPLLESFFVDEYIKKSMEEAIEDMKEEKASKPREIESTSVEGDLTVVTFKMKQDKWTKDKIVLKLKKFADGWKVVEGGSFGPPTGPEGDAKHRYTKADKLVNLKFK